MFQKVLPELIIDGSEGNRMFLLDVSRLALMASARADLPEHSVKRHLSASVSLRVEKCGGLCRHSGWGGCPSFPANWKEGCEEEFM